MKTDQEKHLIRDIQRDTAQAIHKMLDKGLSGLDGDIALGYLYCLDALQFSAVEDVDKFRTYKAGSVNYEL